MALRVVIHQANFNFSKANGGFRQSLIVSQRNPDLVGSEIIIFLLSKKDQIEGHKFSNFFGSIRILFAISFYVTVKLAQWSLNLYHTALDYV